MKMNAGERGDGSFVHRFVNAGTVLLFMNAGTVLLFMNAGTVLLFSGMNVNAVNAG